MIEQISSAISDPPFRNTILPWATEAGPFGPDTEGLNGVDDFFIEVRRPVEDQVAGYRVVGECLTQLLCNPSATRMPSDVGVEDPSSIMRHDEETVQHTEGQCGHGEEVHRGNRFLVVV